jgi:hypothetical protein
MVHDDVNVSLADDYLGRFDEAVQRMEEAGLEVLERLPAIGIVTGSIHADGFENLRLLPEVSDVERCRARRIPRAEGPAV